MNYKILCRSSQLFTDVPKEIIELNKFMPLITNFNTINILKFKSINLSKRFNINGLSLYVNEMTLYQIATLLSPEELKIDNDNDKISRDILIILNKIVIDNVDTNLQKLLQIYEKYNYYNKNKINNILISIILNKCMSELIFVDVSIILIEKLILKLDNNFLSQITQNLENNLQSILISENDGINSDDEYENIRKQKFKNLTKLINFMAGNEIQIISTKRNKKKYIIKEKYLMFDAINRYYIIVLNCNKLSVNKIEYILYLLDTISLKINQILPIFNQLKQYLIDSYKTIGNNFRVKFLIENIMKKYELI